MSMDPIRPKSSETDDFARQAAGPPRSLLGEFWGFLRQEKRWWLVPIVLVLLLFGVLLLLGSTGLAPLIYTLF